MKRYRKGMLVKAVGIVFDGGNDTRPHSHKLMEPCEVGCPKYVHAVPGETGKILDLCDGGTVSTKEGGIVATVAWPRGISDTVLGGKEPEAV